MRLFKRETSKQATVKPCFDARMLAYLIQHHSEFTGGLVGAVQLTSDQVQTHIIPSGREVFMGLETGMAKLWLDSENYCHYSIIPTVSKVKQSSN